MLLVVLQAPPLTVALMSDIASVTGLSAADVRTRMAGVAPWVLVVSANADPLAEAQNALSKLQVRAMVCDPAVAPSDADRVIVRSLAIGPSYIKATDGAGQEHTCALQNVAMIQRGTRSSTSVQTTKTTERKFSAGRALLTGGLSLTKKEVIEQTKKTETNERFVLVARNDGEGDFMLYERRLNYQFLGAGMQASSYANLESVVALLKSHTAKDIDDRLAMPGFVGRLPKTRADPVDLALYLVQLERASLGSGDSTSHN